MKIRFKSAHDAEAIVESLAAILDMLKEQYGVSDYGDIKVNLTLMNHAGEEIELIDEHSGEVFDLLEVHKNLEEVDEQIINEAVSEKNDAGTVH